MISLMVCGSKRAGAGYYKQCTYSAIWSAQSARSARIALYQFAIYMFRYLKLHILISQMFLWVSTEGITSSSVPSCYYMHGYLFCSLCSLNVLTF